jgi:hypothetical protein
MKKYIIHMENSEPLTYNADWLQAENGLIVMYVGLKATAYFPMSRLVSLEVIGEFQPQAATPNIPQPPQPTPTNLAPQHEAAMAQQPVQTQIPMVIPEVKVVSPEELAEDKFFGDTEEEEKAEEEMESEE